MSKWNRRSKADARLIKLAMEPVPPGSGVRFYGAGAHRYVKVLRRDGSTRIFCFKTWAAAAAAMSAAVELEAALGGELEAERGLDDLLGAELRLDDLLEAERGLDDLLGAELRLGDLSEAELALIEALEGKWLN